MLCDVIHTLLQYVKFKPYKFFFYFSVYNFLLIIYHLIRINKDIEKIKGSGQFAAIIFYFQ